MAVSLVLKPYERRQEPGPFRRFMFLAAIVGVGAFYGLLCSILPMQLLFIPLVPILILVALILWMLPDVGGIYEREMSTLMIWFAGINVLWPYYVAISLPGVPWITPARILLGSLTAIVVFNLAISSDFRFKLTDTLKAVPFTRRVFWFFLGVTAVSLVFSAAPFFSAGRFVNNQIYWTMMFVLAAFLSTRRGFVSSLSQVLVWSIIVVSIAGLYEASIQRVFWIERLPSFLKVDPELLATFAEAQNRAGTDVYRVRGTLGVSLYYAEYLGLVFPLVLHYAFTRQKFIWSVLVFLGAIAVAINMYLTNARSGFVGLLVAIVVYGFFAAYRAWRRRSNSIMATTALFAYPAGLMVLLVLVLSWNRLRVLTIGGGQHQASSDARSLQWATGTPKVFSRPLGHGVSQAGDVLGYTNLAGEQTIDTYFLSLLLDYGPLGLASFILLFASVVWVGFKLYVKSETEEEMLVGPIAVGVLNILIVKSVLSSEINLPTAFMLAGCVVGLAWQKANAGAVIAYRGSGKTARAAQREPVDRVGTSRPAFS